MEGSRGLVPGEAASALAGTASFLSATRLLGGVADPLTSRVLQQRRQRRGNGLSPHLPFGAWDGRATERLRNCASKARLRPYSAPIRSWRAAPREVGGHSAVLDQLSSNAVLWSGFGTALVGRVNTQCVGSDLRGHNQPIPLGQAGDGKIRVDLR